MGNLLTTDNIPALVDVVKANTRRRQYAQTIIGKAIKPWVIHTHPEQKNTWIFNGIAALMVPLDKAVTVYLNGEVVDPRGGAAGNFMTDNIEVWKARQGINFSMTISGTAFTVTADDASAHTAQVHVSIADFCRVQVESYEETDTTATVKLTTEEVHDAPLKYEYIRGTSQSYEYIGGVKTYVKRLPLRYAKVDYNSYGGGYELRRFHKKAVNGKASRKKNGTIKKKRWTRVGNLKARGRYRIRAYDKNRGKRGIYFIEFLHIGGGKWPKNLLV